MSGPDIEQPKAIGAKQDRVIHNRQNGNRGSSQNAEKRWSYGLFRAIRDYYELKEYRKQESNRFEGNDWDRDHEETERQWEEDTDYVLDYYYMEHNDRWILSVSSDYNLHIITEDKRFEYRKQNT